jgi:restriction endonuclease
MTIIHRPRKAHLNADDLSRLACNSDDEQEKGQDQEPIAVSLSINVDGSENEFLEPVKKEISDDDSSAKDSKKLETRSKKLNITTKFPIYLPVLHVSSIFFDASSCEKHLLGESGMTAMISLFTNQSTGLHIHVRLYTMATEACSS